LLYFGLFKFSLLWIAAILGAGQYLGQALDLDGDRLVQVWDVARQELLSRLSLALALSATAVAFGLGLMAGVIRTILQFYGFKLSLADGRFRYSRGLLTKSEVVVAQRQIQLGLVEWGVLSGALGWCAFKVQTLGGSDHASGRQELAPFARASEVQPLIALAGLPRFDRSGLRPVSSWHTRSAFIGLVAIPASILAVATIWFPLAGLLLLTLPLPLVVALLRRRHHRYALAETSLLVSRGVLKRREWTVPYGNIQSVTLRRGPLERRMGVTSVRIDTAGGSGLSGPHIHDLLHRDATELVRQLIERVEAARTSAS
jgi:putative membrane protein